MCVCVYVCVCVCDCVCVTYQLNQCHPPPSYTGQVELSYHPSHPLMLYFPYKESQSSRGQDMTPILHFHHHIEETAIR